MTEKVTLKIPKNLYRKLKRRISGTGFSSVTEFVVFVMRSVASAQAVEGREDLTEEEISLVRERLRRLGYLD